MACATQVQFRRGTTADNAGFMGVVGEVTFDTQTHRLLTHDGVTLGGFALALFSDVPQSTTALAEGANLYYTDARARAALSVSGPLNYNNATGAFTITLADSTHNGYLSSADWVTFNGKQAALGFTAENVANKSNDTTLAADSATLYPTQHAAKTYADVGLALKVAKAGDTMTGLLQFSGTGHYGFRLNNLTTTQRNGIAGAAAGMLIWNTTTSRVERYSGAAWLGFAESTTDLVEGSNLYYTDGRVRLALSVSAPLNYNNATGAFTITLADSTHNGYLSSADWVTFNGKQAALGFTAENVANKSNDTAMAADSATLYPTQHAAKTYSDTGLALKVNKSGDIMSGSLTVGTLILGVDGSIISNNFNFRVEAATGAVTMDNASWVSDGSGNTAQAGSILVGTSISAGSGNFAVDSGGVVTGVSFGIPGVSAMNANGSFSCAGNTFSVTNAGVVSASNFDTSGTLASNSDAKIPTQKAVKTYVDANSTSKVDKVFAYQNFR